jgi:hypothetical protein
VNNERQKLVIGFHSLQSAVRTLAAGVSRQLKGAAVPVGHASAVMTADLGVARNYASSNIFYICGCAGDNKEE